MRVSRPSGDTGAADPAVAAALDAYARGTGGEHGALTAIAGSRLLVPVVAVRAEPPGAGGVREGGQPAHTGGHREVAHRGQAADGTDMALPKLIGNDGRTAVIAFTGTETLRLWRPDARPVPVPASGVWAAALSEAADAVVIDVAGPVPLVVEGARLQALARNQPPPPPHDDPDVRAEVAAVTPEFTLLPGGYGADLVVAMAAADAGEAHRMAGEIAARLARRGLRPGFEVRTPGKIFLSRTVPAVSPAPAPAWWRRRPAA